MKKYLLSLIIILVFSSLAFGVASMKINGVAIYGPEGVQDDEVSFGQTIYVDANYTPLEMVSVDNVYGGPSGSIFVFYYSSTIPSTETYLGFSIVSINNLSTLTSTDNVPCSFSFDFTLPAYSAGGAYSFQIAFGMTGLDNLFTTLNATRQTSFINSSPSFPLSILKCSDTTNPYYPFGQNEGYRFPYLKGVNDGPLPVTLSSFNVSFVNGKPTLYWTTESESNNAGWIVYRSYGANPVENGFAQLNLSEIPGQGTTTEPTDYVFVDEYPIFENQTYWYLLESICTDGVVETYPLVQITIPLGGTDPGTPNADSNYGLKQNFPNPFNPDTEINFMLNEDSSVELIIYNQKGEKIKTIFKDDVQSEVPQSAYWDGKDDNGKTVATGVYLYRLRTNSTNYTKRMLLMK
jgi:hypothetical protein